MHFWKMKALSYLSGIYLYRWFAVAVAWAVCIIGWASVAAIPDQYRAEAKVYIDTDNIMDPLLKGLTVTLDSTQEVAVMLKTLITRPTLEQVIHLTMTNANALTPAQLENQVEQLQANISISQLETKNYYQIAYVDHDSSTAASVAQALLSILQNNKVGSTRLNMDDARSFINKKVAEYESRLSEADKRRADFKAANLELLSKGNAGNRIDGTEAAVEQATKDYNSAAARRDSVKAQLDSTARNVPVDERMFLGTTIPTAVTGNAAPTAGRPPASTLPRLQQAQATLDELRSRYTDNHPDVIAAKKLVSQLEAELSAAPKEADADSKPAQPLMVPNPVYIQLQAKFSEEEANVAVQRQRLAAASSDLEQAKREASRAIDVLTKYDELDRDYGNVEGTYKQLLQSREAANLSQARDDQDEGITFRVLEPPQKPEAPTAPNRMMLNSIILLIGLGSGASVAILLTLNAGRLISTDDITAFFEIPVLATVTRLPDLERPIGKRIAGFAFAAPIILLFLTYGGVLAFLQTSIDAVNYAAALASLKSSIHSLLGAARYG